MQTQKKFTGVDLGNLVKAFVLANGQKCGNHARSCNVLRRAFLEASFSLLIKLVAFGKLKYRWLEKLYDELPSEFELMNDRLINLSYGLLP